MSLAAVLHGRHLAVLGHRPRVIQHHRHPHPGIAPRGGGTALVFEIREAGDPYEVGPHGAGSGDQDVRNPACCSLACRWRGFRSQKPFRSCRCKGQRNRILPWRRSRIRTIFLSVRSLETISAVEVQGGLEGSAGVIDPRIVDRRSNGGENWQRGEGKHYRDIALVGPGKPAHCRKDAVRKDCPGHGVHQIFVQWAPFRRLRLNRW